MKTQDENKDVYEQVLLENYEQLERIATRRLQSCRSEIQDAVSRVTVAYYEKIRSGDPPQYPKAWLYGTLDITIKMIYSEINRKKQFEESLDAIEPESHVLIVDKDVVEDIINDQFSDERINKMKDELIDELRASEKELYNSIYKEKKKHREIAAENGNTSFAVKQSHFRLVRKLRKKAKQKIEKNL